MKFCCVTPSYNSEQYIEETMLSVIDQSALKSETNELIYIIADGKSSDKTVEIAKKVKAQHIDKRNIIIEIISQKDDGMYEALANAFKRTSFTSNIYSYINCGDYYSKHAFEIVREILENNKKVHFLTGINTWYNEKSHLIRFQYPFKYKRNLIQKGVYGKQLPFIQQESTFWDSTLHKKIDFEKLGKYRFAGDHYLWSEFSKHEELYIVQAWLAGFKIHRNQLSSLNKNKYELEMIKHSKKTTFVEKIDILLSKIMWLMPLRIKKIKNKHFVEYDLNSSSYITK